jgi:hypothetical protein
MAQGGEMKLTEIRLDRTKSLGNYENIKLGLTAVIEEDETPSDAVERLELFMDWHINASERKSKYAQYLKRLENEDEPEREKLVRWIATYEERRSQVERF